MSDDLRELAGALRGSYGRAHEHHATLGSTNDRALQWLQQGAPHGAVVTADAQHAGRGRRGRTWITAEGTSLFVSVVLRPGPISPPERFGALGLAVAVGLREGLPPLRSPVMLKWPNDLHVEGHKLGGILCEARWVGTAPEVVVGFGINVDVPRFAPGLHATSLASMSAVALPGRATLLGDLLASLEGALEPFFARGFAAVRERYLSHCELMGQPVQVGDVADPGGARRGTALRLDDGGALWVQPAPTGAPFRVDSADVWLVPR